LRSLNIMIHEWIEFVVGRDASCRFWVSRHCGERWRDTYTTGIAPYKTFVNSMGEVS
jgi:hypothetical protein